MVFKEPFSFGPLLLPNNIFYAPLAGCSDLPYRAMGEDWAPGLMWCEMVKMDALIRHDLGTYRLLDREATKTVIGAQLCGSNPKIAGEAASILEGLGFPIIDLNCGCPVDKVTKDGSGSAMLKTPERIGEVISNMVARVKIPVTVKIRAGWDENSIITPLVTEIAEAAGAIAIAIHGRTREQAYRGPANWETIRLAKQAAKKIAVIGNGDLFSPEAVLKMGQETGADAFLIARGTMGRPWFVEEVRRFFKGEEHLFSFQDRVEALKKHFKKILSYQGDRRALVDIRRVGCWYFAEEKGARQVRHAIAHATSIREVWDWLENLGDGEQLNRGAVLT